MVQRLVPLQPDAGHSAVWGPMPPNHTLLKPDAGAWRLSGPMLERRVSMMALLGCGAVAFFGGLSVYFDNELFIKIKPTVLTCLLAAVIAGGRLMGMNPIGAIMGSQIRMTDEGWRALSWIWVAMFLTTALANEIAWRSLSTDDWVTFKVFGITTISLVFGTVSVPIMTKHQIED